MDFIICNEFKWTIVSAVLGLQFGENFKTVACTVDFVGMFKVFKIQTLIVPHLQEEYCHVLRIM